jgi:hypothetical protein
MDSHPFPPFAILGVTTQPRSEIMPGIRETEFQAHCPVFTDQDAADFLSANGEIVSACAQSGMPDVFVVAFATRDQMIGPMCLNPVVAKALLPLLADHVRRLAP